MALYKIFNWFYCMFNSFSCCIQSNSIKKKQGYLLFIQFHDIHGLKEGAQVSMRGMNIGYVKRLKMDLNSILVLVHIKSPYIFIPRNCLIETNQVGILNDFIINIIPLEQIFHEQISEIDVFSHQCNISSFLCHLNYLHGYKGINYDDLIRASTRIAQRFDDPRLYKLFYLTLNNIIAIFNDCNYITSDIANISYLVYYILKSVLFSIASINYES